VIGLYVRLEHRDDRCADRGRALEVAIDECLVRIDDREPPRGGAAEEVARARRRLEQERTQDHTARVRPDVPLRQTNLTMSTIVDANGPASVLGSLWDTTRMRLLVEIGRCGSLSAAAEAVGIGQPSASQHLRLLETAAGQRLVERSGRGSRLTEAGEILAARCAQALAMLGNAEQELAALAGLQTGKIHLGASSVPGVYLLPETLGCFRRDYPSVSVEVEIASSAEILRRLLNHRVQLGLVGAQSADDRIALTPFLEDEIVGVARPGMLPVTDGRVRRGSLATTMLLAREPGSASRAVVEHALAQAGVETGGVWELGASEAVKRAAREGLGVAFLSRFAVAEEVERGELESFRMAGVPPMVRSLNVAWIAARELSPAEQGFVATLTRCCAASVRLVESSVGAPGG
jgi:LysR family transcriptional regulator, low CO2-responsive transcriptional regulator